MPTESKILRADGSFEPAPKPLGDDGGYTLEQLQEIVGGYIEIIPIQDHRIMVLNEEGKLKGLAVNYGATQEANLEYDMIVGDVLICNEEDVK